MPTQRINITLPQKVLKLLRSSIPEGQRSRFISYAIEEKLGGEKSKKLSLEQSLKTNVNYYKKIAKEWEVTLLDGLPDE